MVEIIAIDGPASVGKSTIAKKISNFYNVPMLSSGRLYRAVALKIKIGKIKVNSEDEIIQIAKSLTNDDINSQNLFTSEIDKIASSISKKKYLRNELMSYQRKLPSKHAKGNGSSIAKSSATKMLRVILQALLKVMLKAFFKAMLRQCLMHF